MKENIYLVDASSFLHRAFHANNQLYNFKGEPINAVYGTIAMIKNFIAKHVFPNDKIAIVFDYGGETFRHQKYPAYKANREKKTELEQQKPILFNLIPKMGLPFFKVKNVEADDVIGAIAKKYSEEGHNITIVTGDKDFSQLITPQNNIKLLNAKTNELLGYEEIYKKYNVKPEYFIDYLTIVGDTADNIKGIQGIGPDGASALINKFGSLKEIYENIEKIKDSGLKRAGVLYKNLTEKKEDARLSYFLVKIRTHIPDFDTKLEDFVIKEIDKEELSKEFLNCGLKKFNQELFNEKLIIFKGNEELNNQNKYKI